MSLSKNSRRSALDVGALAEAIVAQWLAEQGWQILQRRWHCQWGELDLVAYSESIAVQNQNTRAALIFVEVKARSRGNWDADGLLAVTPQKQAKLCQAAQLFLAEHPHLAALPCSFDVALVSCQPLRGAARSGERLADPFLISVPVKLGEPIAIAGYRLSLQHYIQAAFD